VKSPIGDKAKKIVEEERQFLMRLHTFLAGLDASDQDLDYVRTGMKQLDSLFLIVVVGEFNSGKSALVNALIGEPVLEEGVTPTTTGIYLIHYSDTPSRETGNDGVVRVGYPVHWLRYLNVVDTPGTNAVIRRHQEISEAFVPRSDLVLFVTSVERPFTESERQFLELIRQWGKKVVLVLNKVDTLGKEKDLREVMDFVRNGVRETLGLELAVFPVSARFAADDSALKPWQRGGFIVLQRYLLQRLDERERLQLKLRSPLGIARKLLGEYGARLEEHKAMLREDRDALSKIDVLLESHEGEMRRDFVYHLSHVQKVLYEMSERGDRFFDEYLRISRIFDMLNREKLRRLFEQEVVADTAIQVERQVNDLIDWLVERDFQQWQAISSFTSDRVARYEGQLTGHMAERFTLNRRALLDSIGRAARESIAGYDKEAEARKLADSVQVSVAQTVLVEAGALGLGALLVKVMAAAVADVTGVLAAGVLATFGFYLIPARRQKAKKEFHRQVEELQAKLKGALEAAFEEELGRSMRRFRSALAPYEAFVRSEEERLQRQTDEMAGLEREIERLEGEIASL
jgi:small GTP-binding protein